MQGKHRERVSSGKFSKQLCDSLAAVHDWHVSEISKLNPLLCFDSLETFKQNLKEVGMGNITVSAKDSIEGTTCINESLSSLLKKHMKWSHSTSFYPGESKFSLTVAERIKQATGLSPENGGKFQITSYPKNVGKRSNKSRQCDRVHILSNGLRSSVCRALHWIR